MNMFRNLFTTCFVLMLLVSAGAENVAGRQAERSMPAAPNVVVSICIGSGDVYITGWDRREVQALIGGDSSVDLKREDGSSEGEANRLKVEVSERSELSPLKGCDSTGSLQLNVPRGSTIQFKSREANVQMSGVAEARIETASGGVSVQNASRSVDVHTLNGDVSISDARGNIRVRSLSGEISVADLQPESPSDTLNLASTTGDIRIDDSPYSRITATSVSGTVNFSGPLAKAGVYDFRTIAADVIVRLPASSSFKVVVSVPMGQISNEMNLQIEGDSKAVRGKKLTGVYGTGDASLTLSSFTGTVALRQN